jgi:hypothetical protein
MPGQMAAQTPGSEVSVAVASIHFFGPLPGRDEMLQSEGPSMRLTDTCASFCSRMRLVMIAGRQRFSLSFALVLAQTSGFEVAHRQHVPQTLRVNASDATEMSCFE